MGTISKNFKAFKHEMKNISKGRIHIGRLDKIYRNNKFSITNIGARLANHYRKKFEKTKIGSKWKTIYQAMWPYDKKTSTPLSSNISSARNSVGNTGFHRYT